MEGWTDKEISQKLIFYTLRPVTRKRREILGWAIKGEMMYMQFWILHRGPNAFFAAGQFWPCFCRQKWGECNQMRSVWSPMHIHIKENYDNALYHKDRHLWNNYIRHELLSPNMATHLSPNSLINLVIYQVSIPIWWWILWITKFSEPEDLGNHQFGNKSSEKFGKSPNKII